MKRFNWLDMLVYRLYYWRWQPIYRRDQELLKWHISFMQEYQDSSTKEPG